MLVMMVGEGVGDFGLWWEKKDWRSELACHFQLMDGVITSQRNGKFDPLL